MKRWFILVVALQAAFIVGEWGRYTVQAQTGDKVVLKAVPVDPRSLFMGNYMALDLAIERIPVNTLMTRPDRADLVIFDTVYVGLLPGRPYARPVSITKSVPNPRREGVVYLRGQIASLGYELSGQKAPPTSVQVDYGIERYYFPEHRQNELLERAQPRNGRPAEISVTVSVTDSGQPILQKLHINGETVEF